MVSPFFIFPYNKTMENNKSPKYTFKTTPFGYEKEAVLDTLNALVNENQALHDKVDEQQRLIDGLNHTHTNIDDQINKLKSQIHQLTDDNRILEYRLFQLNNKYQELQSHSDQFAKVLIDARAKAESIKQEAKIEASDHLLDAEKQLYDRNGIEDPSIDAMLLNYYKAKHNLLVIQEALLKVKQQSEDALDKIEKVMQHESTINDR